MHHLHDCLLVRVKQDLRFPNRSPKHHSCSLLKGHPDSRWSPGKSHTHVPGHARDIKENVIPQTTPSSSIAPVLMLTCPSLVLLTVKRGQHVHPVVCSYAVHTRQTVLHCVFWHVPFKTSFNFFCNLSYRSLSVRSDDKGQSLVPICLVVNDPVAGSLLFVPWTSSDRCTPRQDRITTQERQFWLWPSRTGIFNIVKAPSKMKLC